MLNQLQETDVAILDRQQKTSAIKAELAGDPLAAERAAIARDKNQLDKWRHDLREISAEVDDFSARIKHHEEQLYGGRVTSPKELSALQKDIELLKNHRAPYEDKELGLWKTLKTPKRPLIKPKLPYNGIKRRYCVAGKNYLAN